MGIIVLGARVLGVVEIRTLLEAIRTGIEYSFGLGACRDINELINNATLFKWHALDRLRDSLEGSCRAVELAYFFELNLHGLFLKNLVAHFGREL